MGIYGHRARIGYAAPPFVVEVFPYEFYKIAPPGVTLGITTLAIAEVNERELEQSVEISRRAAREMALRGMNVVVFGGVPVNVSVGFDAVDDLLRATERECGIPVTSSLTAQKHALAALGTKKLGMVQPTRDFPNSYWEAVTKSLGCELVGVVIGGWTVRDNGRIPTERSVELCQQLVREHPDLDTVLINNSHWATVTNIQRLEHELNVDVISASLACTWEGLRRAGITDSIDGFGRLLREH